MKMPRLSLKNACGLIAGGCIVILAAITILVPTDQLAEPLWRWIVFSLAVVAVITLAAQMVKQSHEDRDLGKKLDGLLVARGVLPDAPLSSAILASPAFPSVTQPDIDGEVYRIALSPRVVAWGIVKDIYRIQGRPDEAQIDCDVLVEMYLVNTSKTENRYVRDLRLTADLNGSTITLQRQNDLRAMDMSDKEFEYGIKEAKSDTKPVKQLFSELPAVLAPMQPVEGWVRFLAEGINPDKVTDKSWRLSVVDSLGSEHPITKASQREKKGEVALRRIRD
jgi:hypothetical protein